jgi:hypothetical protein
VIGGEGHRRHPRCIGRTRTNPVARRIDFECGPITT